MRRLYPAHAVVANPAMSGQMAIPQALLGARNAHRAIATAKMVMIWDGRPIGRRGLSLEARAQFAWGSSKPNFADATA
jgi:hypothetical protein